MVSLKRGEGKGWEVDKNQAHPDSLFLTSACCVLYPQHVVFHVTAVPSVPLPRATQLLPLSSSLAAVELLEHLEQQLVRVEGLRRRYRRIE
jgi:hypothetical protein